MKTFNLHILATISVPDDATESEAGRGWVLADGTIIKPFVVLERDETNNLTYEEGSELGVFVDEDQITSVSGA